MLLGITISVVHLFHSDTYGFAAGDGCFMIGLGGKQKLPSTPYEPYKCCPAPAKKNPNVAKLTSTKDDKKSQVKKVSEPPASPKKSSVLPSSPPPKSSSKTQQPTRSSPLFGSNTPDKPVKGKKGLFGSGKYIWWWWN